MTTQASGIRLEALFEPPLTLAEADRDARRGASYGGEDWVVYSLPGGFATCTLSRWNNDALYERFRFVRVVRPNPDYTV